jgi:hypothetical protein
MPPECSGPSSFKHLHVESELSAIQSGGLVKSRHLAAAFVDEDTGI